MRTEVTFLGHSGAAVRLSDTVLVFDDESGTLPKELSEDCRELVFFASHAHRDHYNEGILEFGRRRENVRYVFSEDIRPIFERHPERISGLSVFWVKEHEQYRLGSEDDTLEIRTLHATDQGVAFLIRFRDTVIYHAGDLNCWTWPEESDAYRQKERTDYEREIDRIAGTKIDIAFVPLDPRLGKNEGDGMDYFLRKTDASHIFPIHMWGKLERIGLYRNTLEPADRERICRIEKEGQVFVWE